jgi:hypothetical protein
LYVAKRVWVVPGVQLKVCGVVMDEPSTCIAPLLEGFDPTVICTVLAGAKVAVSVIGPFIVTVAEAEEPLKEPEPEPVHETKEKPLLGVPSIGITALAF